MTIRIIYIEGQSGERGADLAIGRGFQYEQVWNKNAASALQ